ncbi:MAG: TetR/AcrR family transcriptional regulator [Acidimicrobiales bacterium]
MTTTNRPGETGRSAGTNTAQRILDAALVSFGSRGYEATSLDALAAGLGITKQSILYWFPSKEALLQAVIDRSAAEVGSALDEALGQAGDGWDRIDALLKAVFRLAARRPDLFNLLREVTRLGAAAATGMASALEPLIARAAGFLADEMAAGRMRQRDPRRVLLSTYSAVIGVATEVEVMRALGYDLSVRTLVRRHTGPREWLRRELAP